MTRAVLIMALFDCFVLVTDKPLSVNFLRHRPNNRLKIPIEFVNADQSADLKRGCFLFRVNKFLECICEGEVPSSIELDLTGAIKGQVFRINSPALKLPPKVRPSPYVPSDFVLGIIKTPARD